MPFDRLIPFSGWRIFFNTQKLKRAYEHDHHAGFFSGFLNHYFIFAAGGENIEKPVSL
jgi:hypothetical protein